MRCDIDYMSPSDVERAIPVVEWMEFADSAAGSNVGLEYSVL